jgi:NAD(P)-dependent dehydrogenase (short-subunit alcohol dehydrogenase family)
MAQKIAFITGGNRGLGFQTALDLKGDGVKVVIGSRNLAQGEEAVKKLRAAGVDADVLQFDITKAADYKAARGASFRAPVRNTPLRRCRWTCCTRSSKPISSPRWR